MRTTTRPAPVDLNKPSRAVQTTDILVVDDLPEKILVYRAVLETPEFNIVTARSGSEALKKVLEGDFAVILLDVSMPGMDGFETAQLIRKRKRSSATPIIFLTAFTDEVRMAQGYASGAVDYIATPVVPEILRAKVQVFVELFRMRRQSAAQAEERARRSETEEAAVRSAFLADAGKEMMRSLEFEPMLLTLAGVPVPFLADLSALCVLDETGKATRMECVWAHPLPGEPARKQSASVCPYPWLAEAFERTVASGQHMELQDLPAALPNGAESTNPWPAIQGGCALVLPLVVRNKVHGALALVRKDSEPGYPSLTVALARELASRAAIMLENALLVQGIQEGDRRKDEFLGMLAHELRNPLAPLSNAVEILEMSTTADSLEVQALGVINRQVKHMTRLVDDLLDATRIARGKVLLRKEQCDLCNIVRQTAADYRMVLATDMRFELDVPEGPLPVYGDPTRLAQMVGNLLHNAHKFNDPGGYIALRLHVDEEDGLAHMTVKDTGMGIDPAMLPYIFDVFRQADQGLDRSRGGLGLGLTLVKGLAELHDGTVEVISGGSGQGATFTVRLPLHLTTAPAPAAHQPEVPNASRSRILVIDDNRDAADTIKLLLERNGHDVRTAYTGLTGVETAREFRPQVIICDIGLPGMDGYEVARVLRGAYAGDPLKLIALTGYGRKEDQARTAAAGFNMHMTKPIDFQILRKALTDGGDAPARPEV